MNSKEKALNKKKGKGKEKVNNEVKETGGKLDEKGNKPKKLFGAKNNDSEQD